MIVQEVYIGRIPEIDEIFEEFKDLRSTYKVWKSGNTARKTAKIEKMIEDFFGFKTFCLTIESNPVPNAYTFPVSASIDLDPDMYIKSSSKGYRYIEKAKVAAITRIHSGLFTNKTFSDEEVFAIFLHEIGHSFVHRSPYIAAQQDVYKSMIIIQIIQQLLFGILTANPLAIIDAVESGAASLNFIKRFNAAFEKAIKKVPILRNTLDLSKLTANTILNALSNTIYTILTGTGITALMSNINKWEYNEYGKNQIKLTGHSNAYARSQERLSDDFATMYGFGNYLSSALLKMENPDNQGLYMKVIHNIPIIRKIFNYSDAISIEMNGLLGAHPSSADRILSILNSMESDLKNDKDIPEKAKKEMRVIISQQRTLIKDIKDGTSKIKNKNDYLEALTLLGFENGDSEDFLEKKFTDRKALKKFYDERKIRKEQAFSEQAEMDIILMGLEDFI